MGGRARLRLQCRNRIRSVSVIWTMFVGGSKPRRRNGSGRKMAIARRVQYGADARYGALAAEKRQLELTMADRTGNAELFEAECKENKMFAWSKRAGKTNPLSCNRLRRK
jgi:hypothetical protein